MVVYKAKIHAKTWEDYFWLTSQDPEGDIMCDILTVELKVGDTVHRLNTRTNKYDPPLPKTANLAFLNETILLGDVVYKFDPLSKDRLELVKKFKYRLAKRPGRK